MCRARAGDIGTQGTELAGLISAEYNKIESSLSLSPGNFLPQVLHCTVQCTLVLYSVHQYCTCAHCTH